MGALEWKGVPVTSVPTAQACERGERPRVPGSLAWLLGRGLHISEPQFPPVKAGTSTHGAQDQAG